MLSDALQSFGQDVGDEMLDALAYGLLSPAHAGNFKGFLKQLRHKHGLYAILKGEQHWPDAPADRDVLYFLAQSFRVHLLKELPEEESAVRSAHQAIAIRAKDMLRDLARISVEIAQSILGEDAQGRRLPAWFLVEVARDLPRLAGRSQKEDA
jgi:hypothetical protein